MTTITADELTTLKKKLGNGGAGFTDPDDFDRIWVEAGESMSKAIWICYEELMNDAARFNDYTQNDTQEKREQVFKHIAEKLVPYWKAKAEAEDEAANSSKVVRIMGTRVVPPRRMERPLTDPGDPTDWRMR